MSYVITREERKDYGKYYPEVHYSEEEGQADIKVTYRKHTGYDFGEFKYTGIKHGDKIFQSMPDADVHIATKILESLDQIGVSDSRRERKGCFLKGTHMLVTDQTNNYKIEVASYGNYVRVKAKGDSEKIERLLSQIETVLSQLKPEWRFYDYSKIQLW